MMVRIFLMSGSLLFSSCSSIDVTSSPSKARVLIDGKDTGRLTPAQFRVRDIKPGVYSISVSKQGFTEPHPQTIRVKIAAGKVIWGFFPPLFPKFVIGDLWKRARDPRRFELEPVLTEETSIASRDITALAGKQTDFWPEVLLPPAPEERTHIAVADLSAWALSAKEVKSMTEQLRMALEQTRFFRVVSTSDMKAILEQQGFQRSGACDDRECLVEMGRFLSVDRMVGGSIGQVGGTFTVNLRIVDVETGEVLCTVGEKYKGESDDLLLLIEYLGNKLTAKHAKFRAQTMDR